MKDQGIKNQIVKSQGIKKLQLNKETIRQLTDSELDGVVGGGILWSLIGHCNRGTRCKSCPGTSSNN